MRIVYFNVGWMDRYAGNSDSDLTRGSHGYLKHHPHGGECFNFLATESGKVQGYRPPGADQQTNITRLGASRTAEKVDEVLVVWLARAPCSNVTLIVGWYWNATVYRQARRGPFKIPGEDVHYTVEAMAKDAVCLPPASRTFRVQSSRTSPGSGFGQKPTWFGSDEVNARVWEYVQGYRQLNATTTKRRSKIPPRNSDPELRRAVEQAAVRHAKTYFSERYGRHSVESVETQAKGWDLEVTTDSGKLLVEVKGLLNEILSAELTPNEYRNMMKPEHRERYVIFVLNRALAEKPAVPIPSVFWHAEGSQWTTEDGRVLEIKPLTGAVISCSRS